MNIIRAGYGDTDLFSASQLAYGACCFYTQDKACRYYFEIQGQAAILFADRQVYLDAAIDAFLFYSGFVTAIVDTDGQVLRERNIGKLGWVAIQGIQPSQFYINERKLAACKQWIKSQKEIIIPTTMISGKLVSLDGHTRLRAALDLGYSSVYTYAEDSGDYIAHFVEEAIRRGIHRISDMKVLTDADYRIMWHQYCEGFFKSHP